MTQPQNEGQGGESTEFISDEPMTPSTGGLEFSSNEPMTPGAEPAKKRPSMREKAQHGLGWTIVGTAMAAYALIIGVFLFGGRPSELSELMNYVLPSLQTLVAAVVGFYFGSKERD